MGKLEIMNNVSRAFHKVGFKLKKYSPEILVVAGVTGTVVSTVMACKATTKVSAILEESKNNIDQIHAVTKDPNFADRYSAEDSKKDLTIVYAQTGLKLAKLYAPAVAVGALSITSILAGHNITRKRNVALAAAYATVDSGFKEYRNRVVERFGEELDRELKYNIRAREVEEVAVNEDGTETVVKKTVETAEVNAYSEYARFFDEYCAGWEKNAEYNLVFLRQAEQAANRKLRNRGHLFLNEVYDLIGIKRTEAGQSVGWVYDADRYPSGHVSFGIYDLYDDKKRDFVNGRERSILLDFNVDGIVYDLMK